MEAQTATDRRSHAALLRVVYEEWGRGDFRSPIGPYAKGFAWGWSDEFPGLAGVFRDPASARRRLLEWLRQWRGWRVEAEEFLAAGDSVVVLCRYRGSGNASGVRVDTRGAHIWTMRDGEAVRLEIFSSPERALAAAGLADRLLYSSNRVNIAEASSRRSHGIDADRQRAGVA